MNTLKDLQSGKNLTSTACQVKCQHANKVYRSLWSGPTCSARGPAQENVDNRLSSADWLSVENHCKREYCKGFES